MVIRQGLITLQHLPKEIMHLKYTSQNWISLCFGSFPMKAIVCFCVVSTDPLWVTKAFTGGKFIFDIVQRSTEIYRDFRKPRQAVYSVRRFEGWYYVIRLARHEVCVRLQKGRTNLRPVVFTESAMLLRIASVAGKFELLLTLHQWSSLNAVGS